MDVAGLQALVDGLDECEIIYLEDVRAKLVAEEQADGAAGKLAPRLVAARPDPPNRR